MHRSPELTEGFRSQTHQPRASHPDAQYGRQAFHHPHTSLGAAGHWIKTLGILSPLVIGEMVKDPDKRWRWVRIASVATALVSEALWTRRIHKERQEREERRECYPSSRQGP